MRLAHFITTCKLLFIAVCLGVVFSGQHPPAHAQEQQVPISAPNVFAVAIQNGIQSNQILTLQKSQEDQKTVNVLMMAKIDANTNAISAFHGEGEAVAFLLALLQIVGMVVAAKRKVG